MKALLTRRWLSTHCVAIGLVTIARDIVGIWGTCFQVATTTGTEAPKEWPEHPRNTEIGPGWGWVALR